MSSDGGATDKVGSEAETQRRPRADSLRNRERLMEAAKAGFAETGPHVSLEEIARRAGVGIGTLYRHFASRDALVAAVYRREVQQLADAADRLLAERPPGEAVREWFRLSVDYLATKKLIVPALSASGGGPAALFAVSGPMISGALTRLVERARAAGDIRADVEPADLMRIMASVSYGAGEPGWQASALRLIDVLMDGLRAAKP